MDITWYGHSCFRIKGKSTAVLTDPFDPTATGLKTSKDWAATILTVSHNHDDHNNIAAVTGEPKVLTGPGEYEISGITIEGVDSYHDNTQGSERGKNTIFNIYVDGVNIVHLGDLGHQLSEEQIATIGNVDILLIPVGGVYTIDAENAAKVVASLEPRVIIPMHYKLPELKYELNGVEDFLKEMAAENVEPLQKLTITKDKLPEETQVVVLNKS